MLAIAMVYSIFFSLTPGTEHRGRVSTKRRHSDSDSYRDFIIDNKDLRKVILDTSGNISNSNLLFFFGGKLAKIFPKFSCKYSTVPLDDIAQTYFIFYFLPIS